MCLWEICTKATYFMLKKYMHWLFQLYTSNVYFVSSLIHFQLRLKGPCTFRAGGPGAQLSWTRAPSTLSGCVFIQGQLWCCWAVVTSWLQGNCLDFCNSGLAYQPMATTVLGQPNTASFTPWYSLVKCNEIRTSLSIRWQKCFGDT